MLGSAVVRRLAQEDCEILTVAREELDLRDQAGVKAWFEAVRPDVVVLAAARVGGVLANSRYPANFLSDNLSIQDNVIQTAASCSVKKLLFVSSSCVYPRLAEQPIREEALMTGPLEPTNVWYGVAKIAGMMQCTAYRQQYGLDFIAAVPGNLYGPGDYFDNENSHVIPAFIRRFHDAVTNGLDEVTVWGGGSARREFVHVEECADALIFLLKNYSSGEIINIGSGVDISIRELATLVASVAGFNGRIAFDASKPEGAPRRLLSTERLTQLGWQSKMSLREGLASTYQWFLSSRAAGHVPRGFGLHHAGRDVDALQGRSGN